MRLRFSRGRRESGSALLAGHPCRAAESCGERFAPRGPAKNRELDRCSLRSPWFLTYPALQKGGAWLSETLTMERGRFTPCTWRIDYRLRRCVPGCLALRCSDPRGCDPRGVDGAKGTRRRLL